MMAKRKKLLIGFPQIMTNLKQWSNFEEGVKEGWFNFLLSHYDIWLDNNILSCSKNYYYKVSIDLLNFKILLKMAYECSFGYNSRYTQCNNKK